MVVDTFPSLKNRHQSNELSTMSNAGGEEIAVAKPIVTDSVAAMWEMDALQVHTTGNAIPSPCPNSTSDVGTDSTLFPQAVIDELVACYASLPKLGQGLKLRPLHVDDFDRGFLRLLGQLTDVGVVSRAQFVQRFRTMAACRPAAYYVLVVEEIATSQVVASATLVVEWKFIHSAGSRGRIEDVVVDDRMRGRHLGVLLNQYLVTLARHLGAYKISLECKDRLIGFYEQFGFQRDHGNNFMVQRFESPKPKI